MMNCEYSYARDCSECDEPVCLRHMTRRNDWDDEWRDDEYWGGNDGE